MNLRFHFNSIAIRLILFGIVVIVLSVMTQIFVLTNYLRKDVVGLTSVQLQTIAGYVAKHIDNDVEERREFLERIAAQLPRSAPDDREETRKWLMERHLINPLFSNGLSLLDLSGVALSDYPVLPDRAGASFADRDYFRKAAGGEFAMGKPVFGRVSGRPVLPMAVPVRDGDGKVSAVLVGVAALRSSNFIEALYTTRVGNEGGLVLVSPRDELVIGASDLNFALRPTPKEGLHPQHDKAMTGFRGVGIWIPYSTNSSRSTGASRSGPAWAWQSRGALPK